MSSSSISSFRRWMHSRPYSAPHEKKAAEVQKNRHFDDTGAISYSVDLEHGMELGTGMFTPTYESMKGRPAIGISRVSGVRQGTTGLSLQAQEDAIRTCIKELGAVGGGIYSFIGSGMADRGGASSPDLLDGLKSASSRRGFIVVTDISRLGRSELIADIIDQLSLDVWVIELGRIASQPELRRGLREAEHAGHQIRRRARLSVNRARQAGKCRPDRSQLLSAGHRGSIENKSRADEHAEKLAQILKKHDPEGKLTARELAALLLRLGMRTRRGLLFKEDRLRRTLRKARAIIAEDAAPYDDFDDSALSL